MASKSTRTEYDSMGEMEVPSNPYYGAQTARPVENFHISGIRKHSLLIKAMGMIKLAAAESNMQLGLLSKKAGAAIVRAAKEVIDGKLDEHEHERSHSQPRERNNRRQERGQVRDTSERSREHGAVE